MILQFTMDQLTVKILDNRQELGIQAAKEAAEFLRKKGETQSVIRVVFAAAPSQREFLKTLREDPSIPWTKIQAFHMDEYLGLPFGHPQSFGAYLTEEIFRHVPLGAVHLFRGDDDPQAEGARYAKLLQEAPLDAVFLGIGENGHLAFNDPPVADFADPQAVKIITLEETSRHQQVHDGCFAALEDVPKEALTLTIPILLSAERLFVMVPGPTKAKAVERTLFGPVATICPASILRTCPQATLYLDPESSALGQNRIKE